MEVSSRQKTGREAFRKALWVLHCRLPALTLHLARWSLGPALSLGPTLSLAPPLAFLTLGFFYLLPIILAIGIVKRPEFGT